jgi:putative tryptophan/tyrosine transport system substrate-binding protein
MKRREFIAGLGGAAAWPLAAQGQQTERVRRIGVLMLGDENDPIRGTKGWLSAFMRGLAELGWTDGRNLRMDVRWDGDNLDRQRMYAKELVDLQPDVIFAITTPQIAALQEQTRTIPIVFAGPSDPIGSGFVASLSRPGGNMTGFMFQEPGMAGKWLELLTEIAPGVKRVAIMFNPDTAPYVRPYYLPSFEAAARSLKLVPIVAPVHSDAEIETAIGSLGGEPGGGLVLAPDAFTTGHRAVIISLSARNNVPAVSRADSIRFHA